eukprot:6464699-Amphidinium_carterae.2
METNCSSSMRRGVPAIPDAIASVAHSNNLHTLPPDLALVSRMFTAQLPAANARCVCVCVCECVGRLQYHILKETVHLSLKTKVQATKHQRQMHSFYSTHKVGSHMGISTCLVSCSGRLYKALQLVDLQVLRTRGCILIATCNAIV